MNIKIFSLGCIILFTIHFSIRTWGSGVEEKEKRNCNEQNHSKYNYRSICQSSTWWPWCHDKDYITYAKETHCVSLKKELIECFVLATSYFPLHMSIIAATAFHFRVRNENGCFHSAESPEQKIQLGSCCYRQVIVVLKFPNRIDGLVLLGSMPYGTYT